MLSSALLLVWLLAATLFEWLYKPAQQGRKIAYLTVASFLFLALVMAMLLAGGSEHAQPRAEARNSEFRIQNSEVCSTTKVHSAFCVLNSEFASRAMPPLAKEVDS